MERVIIVTINIMFMIIVILIVVVVAAALVSNRAEINYADDIIFITTTIIIIIAFVSRQSLLGVRDDWTVYEQWTSWAYFKSNLQFFQEGGTGEGGAIVTFPATPKREKAKPEDLRLLLQYLLGIPCDDVRDLCFTVLIDMRGSSTWSTVKPILKVLQEHFSTQIQIAHIIKPDNFWQKQRTSLGSQKYKFETNLSSLDSLYKYVDPCQLTTDMDGTLHYDHQMWIELRVTLEDFLWQSSDMLDRLDDIREDLNHNDFADDVNGAKKGMDQHNEIKKKIIKIPVDTLDNIGQRLFHRLSSCEGGSSYDSGYSGRDSSASNMACNPDMQACIPQIMQLLDQVHSGQQQLLQLWQIKKVKLDQCVQLRLFEQDCEKMFDWIHHNREAFLSNYVEIGHSYSLAKKIQNDHDQFTIAANNVFVDVSGILTEASKLIENNHYASQHVRNVATRLDKTWKEFAEGLDERTTVLTLSVLFHQKAEQYVENVSKWSKASELGAVSTDIPVLEASIHHHQTLYENMCQAYTEVHSTSKKLLYQLDHLVQICNVKEDVQRKHSAMNKGPSNVDPTADYSEGASHVLSVIHEILGHHRSLEVKWHAKKIKLHQRLALRLFQEDVKQVLDWLQNHGEVFLRKNVGIGRSIAKARAYQKSHETFEGVVQNTYTNAEKLLAAASELAQTGECNADDIYSVAHELESHISGFAQRVEVRRRILELAAMFYAHVEELNGWLSDLRQELMSEDVSDSLEESERLIEQFSNQRDSTLDAIANTITEGKTLIEEVKINAMNRGDKVNSSGGNIVSEVESSSVVAVNAALDKLNVQKEELNNLWSTRKMRLDLCLQLRLFERDALELLSQYELWADQLNNGDIPRELKETEIKLRNLTDHVNHIQTATFEVAQRGQDLLQRFESSGLTIMADVQYDGQTKVQILLEYIQEREMDIEDFSSIRRVKLEQRIQLCQFECDANQVIRWIQSAEGMLTAGFSVPGSLIDAEQLKKEHEQFQTAIEKTHASAVHVRQRAETLLNNNHYDPQSVKDIADRVTSRWQQLVTQAEERHKLVTASLNFYKTAEQVCSVLDSLEREYKRDDDWLSRHSTPSSEKDRVTFILQGINKHQEQKEAFLKACTLARRTAETFIKYSNRSLQYFSHNPEATFAGPESKVKAILEKLLSQENRVLEYWTTKKKRLDQHQQFCLFERSARQSLEWIKEEGDIYLNTHTNVGTTKEETQSLLQEHNSFKEKAKETREKVKLLLQLADTLVEKGHAHAPTIKNWVTEVDETYKDFSRRMDEYRVKLEKSLGESTLSKKDGGGLSIDRNSDPSLETKFLKDDLKQMKELNEEKRKSARRKEFIMAELLETERSYVKDLETAISSFLGPMKTSPDSVPGPLKGKEDIIFGNVEEILGFHKSIFLKELEKYESMPEDVGHCFVTWALKFDSYVTYCTNKPHSTALLVATSGTKYFENLQRQKNLEHPIAAYLIKPVQRITKYQLLLKDLLSCCDVDNEIKDGLEVCLNVPKKANDALHLSMLEGCDLSHAALGEVVLQDAFHIWDPKQIIKKAKDRHIFLFELFLVTSKQVRDPNGKSKYIYKSRMTMSSEMGVTEHIEGDECKFAVWTGRSGSTSENKMILKASSIDVKHNWVKKLRELIQETYFNASLPTISVVSTSTPSTTTTSSKSHGSKHHLRFSREYEDMMEENTSSTGGTGIENMERGSLASFGSGNTTDSDKGCETTWVITDFSSSSIGELSVTRGQQVEILEISSSSTSVLVRLVTSAIPESSATSGPPAEGLVPISVLKQPPGGFRALARHELDHHHHHHLHHLHDSNEASNSSSSPVGKKRGFGGRWLPNIRKLSQGKLDKGGGAPSPLSGPEGGGTRHLPLIKQTSKSKIVGTSSGGLITKAPSFTTVEGMGNKSSHPSECEDDMKSSSASASTTAAIVASTSTSHEETEDVDVAEVPPPMQPISSIPPTTSTSSPPEGLDMSECSITDKGTENDSTLVCDSSSNNDKTLKGERSDTLESNDETSNSSALIQRQYRLNELLDSEKMYVKDLEQCCQYINYMKDFKEGGKDESIHMPDDLKEGKDRMIFGNIEAIYEWHRDFFSKNLEKCIQNPIELGNLFKKYDRKFQMYVVYCQNKPKSEYIVSEYIDTYFEEIRMKLGFKLRLTDLLIKPVQRLTKYHMLLEAILKYSQRAGMLEEAEAISRAFHVMTIVPNQANDMMDIGRLQGFEGKITAQGKLLYRGPLSCLDNFSGGPIPNGGGSTAKMKPFTVFLFEQIMIFSETVGKKTQFTSPVYVYVAHFLVNKMSLEENVDDGHPCKFMIRSTDPARDALNIMCQTDEPESRDKWISIIKKQLQTQMDFLRALQAPIAYHNKLAKDYFL
ncbi:triple functional domain protein isoform X3 [Lepeophtheirus salmonis]|uniref:triple functional domain protein isoform X3 n=1 Tax=Lepeophtheirus salmonis TaxID=72036 RepID=UPI001AE27751|nr:triple functional domain protein-like isoform X3 [Lepeophtheirus salmonis]